MFLRKSSQRGFTLLELLVVLLIIGLLAGYVGPKYFSQIGKSNATAALAQIRAFESALEQYRVDTGHFPTTAQWPGALLIAPSGETKWNGPYLKKEVPADPWGHQYVYTSPGGTSADGKTPRDYDIVSYGRDGAAGGTGEDADITSY